MSAAEIFLLRDAGVVKRSHTLRTLFDRNVAEHSWGVAMLVRQVYAWAGLAPPSRVLLAALCHDLSELVTGDLPATAKREHPALRAAANAVTTPWEKRLGLRYELTDDEQLTLLYCDRMEFALYALEEVTAGNRFFAGPAHRITTWLQTMPPPVIGDKNMYTPCSALLTEINHNLNQLLPMGWRDEHDES